MTDLCLNLDLFTLHCYKLGQRYDSFGSDLYIDEHPLEGWYASIVRKEVRILFANFSPGRRGYSKFPGFILKDDKQLSINELTNPTTILSHFQCQPRTFEDDVSLNMEFELSGELVEFDWDIQNVDQPILNYVSVEKDTWGQSRN